MPNFEYKKDRMCAHTLNLALDSIVIVFFYLSIYPRTEGFCPMVSSAVWGKAPTARKNALNGSQRAAGENFEVGCMFSSVLPLK